ncbi:MULTISPECIES: hypothetical protein [unclassified Shewanella]|uniref:hypothetical protein n=1 Tax=unclassified Shewanella TaxID=196818 RepID=UPI00200475B4|nr:MULTISPECIES: hypothetical protein [unclassified Shewanella]MCK7633016.1 hypothetical protein [Shewanella sp. JNE17]MCK7648385.1 hypothetical protein [Shewanella sp. JNE8]MCK7656479.1 hypothetical protein [Shewanella sp. JNE4-2]UPO32970.1 hypothetical protein MZ182_09165 [Shewanella sp. JNE2]
MRKSSILALLIAFIGTILSAQVSASIDDVVKRYQQIYMWEQVATFCKGKAPTELQEDWELIESVLKYQGGYWGGQSNQSTAICRKNLTAN